MKQALLKVFAGVIGLSVTLAQELNRKAMQYMIATRLAYPMADLYSRAPYDNALLLKDAGLVAATANGAIVIDIGNGMVDAYLNVDATAIEVNTGDESYVIILEGSLDADFSVAGNIVALARMVLGSATATAMAPTGVTSTAGRYQVPFRNIVNGVPYRYVRIRTVVAGTIATGINFRAFLSPDID